MKILNRFRSPTIMLLCSLTFSFSTQSAVNLSDSLPLKEIKQYIQTNDTSGLSAALWNLNQNFSRYKSPEFLQLLHQGEKHSLKTDAYCLFGFYSLQRIYYDSEGNTTKTMEYALKCYNLLKSKPESPALFWLMVDIGNLFYRIRDYNQAQVFYEEALDISRLLKEEYGKSVIYVNMGMIAEQKGLYPQALFYFRESITYRFQSGNKQFISDIYPHISNVFFKLEKLDSALVNLGRAKYYYEHFGRESDLLVEVPAAYNLGYYQYHVAKNNFKEADLYLQKVRNYADVHNLSDVYINSFFVQATCLMEQKKYEEALKALHEVLPIVKNKKHILSEKDVYELLSECYTKLGQFEKATEVFKQYLAIDDSIAKISLYTEFNAIRAITELHKNELSLNRMKRDVAFTHLNNELERRNNKISSYIAGFATVGFILVSVLFWQFVTRGKKVEKLRVKLSEQHNNIKIQSNELRKTNQIKDKIFSVIAHDLRNPLNRLLVELALIKREIPPPKSTIVLSMENTLKETIDLFEHLLQWSRRENKEILYSPSMLNVSESINKIITFYLSEIQQNKIKVINNCMTLNAFVDTNVALTLLRNILGNAIKAVGTEGTIEIQCTQLNEKEIELTFFDSGSGFSESILDEFNDDEHTENIGEGTGLMLCKTLAKYNGWAIKLSNESIHGGAKITLTIPAYRKALDQQGKNEKQKELETVAFSEPIKKLLEPLKKYKIYQTSELRHFLNEIETDDPQLKIWIKNAMEAIHEGNNTKFQELLQML